MRSAQFLSFSVLVLSFCGFNGYGAQPPAKGGMDGYKGVRWGTSLGEVESVIGQSLEYIDPYDPEDKNDLGDSQLESVFYYKWGVPSYVSTLNGGSTQFEDTYVPNSFDVYFKKTPEHDDEEKADKIILYKGRAFAYYFQVKFDNTSMLLQNLKKKYGEPQVSAFTKSGGTVSSSYKNTIWSWAPGSTNIWLVKHQCEDGFWMSKSHLIYFSKPMGAQIRSQVKTNIAVTQQKEKKKKAQEAKADQEKVE